MYLFLTLISQAIVLTSFWILNNSKKKEIRLQQEFQAFLHKNLSFKMTLEEVIFILGRNGMNMMDLSQDFDETTTAANFKTFIQELVSLSGQLLANLTDVLYCFFKSREAKGKIYESDNVEKYAGYKDLAKMLVKADKEFKTSKMNMSENHLVAASSEECSIQINNPNDNSSKIQEAEKKIPNTVVKDQWESDLEVVKIEEENKCLRNEKKLLEEKFTALKKEQEHRRFENAAFVEILSLILEGGSLDVTKLNNAGYRNVVLKIQKLLLKPSPESNKTYPLSRISSEFVEESIVSTEVEEEALAEVEEQEEALAEEQKTVRVRLFQTGSHSGLQEQRLVNIPSGTQLLPLSALQVAEKSQALL